MFHPWQRSGLRLAILMLGLGFAFDLLSHIVTEGFWFQEVGYLQVFWTQLLTRGALWIIAFCATVGFLQGNLGLAQRLQYPHPHLPVARNDRRGRDSEGQEQSSPRAPVLACPPLNLGQLLFLVVGLELLLSVLLWHYGQVALSYWQPVQGPSGSLPTSPPSFQPTVIWQTLLQVFSSPWQLGLLFSFAIAITFVPQFLLNAIAILLGLGFGLILSGQWPRVLGFFFPTFFDQTEPLFEQDISFYIFSLPIWELLEFWLVGLSLYTFIAIALIYLLSGDSLSEGRFPGLTLAQMRHLQGLGGCLMLVVALSHWLNRYRLLYSPRGVAYGASYTDTTVQLPVATGLTLLSLTTALMLFVWAFAESKQTLRSIHIPLLGVVLYCLGVVSAGIALPAAVQRLEVQPSELARERPYIERSIASTRQAFNLDDIEVQTFNPIGTLTEADLQENESTIRNIRLWDTQPLLETNRQLQQLRSYYRFPDVDIDRYLLKDALSQNRERLQVMLAARELDLSSLPANAQTWINRHLIYTHGYGFTFNFVNTTDPGGLPDYFVRDLVPEADGQGRPILRTPGRHIRASIPIGHPRTYYGQITDTYVMAPSAIQELDYPGENGNVYNTYDGQGGIAINPWWHRLLFAAYLRDWRLLLTPNFTPDTKLLFRRNINQRIRAIAPFLRFDSDPYLVIADPNLYPIPQESRNPDPDLTQPTGTRNYLYWIVDAYTTSDRYPYSNPGTEPFNYIRNAVKVVIDAYNGSVVFYVTDPQDPLIRTWQRIFPTLFHPLDEIPVTLRTHIRYPTNLFTVQSQHLLTYHMTNPQVFYNGEDQWQIPIELYAEEPRPVDPYYLIMKLPTGQSEEFVLLSPFTPTNRNNLVAWLAARSDGNNYGKLLLYQFPKERLVYGPQQIEARINQDPVISQQISLWNRRGARVIQGNLLVIPIEQSLLYVEPLYLKAGANGLPTLARIIVAYKDRIAMASTLNRALDAIFRPRERPSAP